jgi:hypothetical protein
MRRQSAEWNGDLVRSVHSVHYTPSITLWASTFDQRFGLYTEEAKMAETIVNRNTQMNRRRRTVDIELIILLVALILLSIAAQWVNRNLNLTEADLPAGELRFAPPPSPEVFADLYGAPSRIDP